MPEPRRTSINGIAEPDGNNEPDHSAELSVADPVLGKSRLLSHQCDTCIFRPGNPMHLESGRLRDLVDQARARESFIVCHCTLPHYLYPDAEPAICRGFAHHYSTQALQVIERLFGFVEVHPQQPPPASSTDTGTRPG